ncbi:MAG: hypothetical protein ACFFE4_12770, partial [Candidatus Thorarchaeota archaeon]
SITKIENIMKENSIFMVIPGDTYFDFELLQEIIMLTKSYSNLIHDTSILFYQELKGIKLRNEHISIIKTEKNQVQEKIKQIEQLQLKSIHRENYYKQIVPIFVLGFKYLEYLIETEKKDLAKSIRDIINVLIKEKKSVYAIPINSKNSFYDIDTQLDFLRLTRKKRGQ